MRSSEVISRYRAVEPDALGAVDDLPGPAAGDAERPRSGDVVAEYHVEIALAGVGRRLGVDDVVIPVAVDIAGRNRLHGPDGGDGRAVCLGGGERRGMPPP